MPETVFYYRIFPYLNRNHCLLDNKFNCSDILSANHLLIPDTILKVIGKTVFDSRGNVIEDELTLQKYLNSLSLQEIIAKKANCGSGGKQILIFRKTQGQYSCGSTVLSYKSLQEQFNDWLFQEMLVNIPTLAEVHPFSLNTFRIMTFSKNGTPIVLYSMLKFGNNAARTDNAHTNGIYVKVNMQKGMTEGIAYSEDLEEFDKHPYTNKEIGNVLIPNFTEVIEAAKKATNLFPEITFIGWDIAMTTKGVVILEGNSSPGLTIIQRTHGGMSDFINLSNEYIEK